MKQPALQYWKSGLCLFVLCLWMALGTSCNLQGMADNPGELFINAVSGLSGKDNFAFEGRTRVSVDGLPMQQGITFAGNVTGHNRLAMRIVRPDDDNPEPGLIRSQDSDGTVLFSRMQNQWTASDSTATGEAELMLRWNPLAKLERLNTMEKRVEASRDGTESRLTVLNVKPNPAEVTEMARADLKQQLQQLDAGRKLVQLQRKLQLTDKQASDMRPEVEHTVKMARSRLEEVIATLTAEETCLIWVDRVSSLPRKMQVVTDMSYKDAGIPKREKTQVDYVFAASPKPEALSTPQR